MKKTSLAAFIFLLSGLSALALAAPAESAGGIAPAKPARARCVFPDSPRERAPAWVCAQKAPGSAVVALGWHKKSKAGVQFTKDQAVAKARVELARAMTQELGRKLETYAAQRQIGGGAAKKVLTPAVERQTQRTLVGSRIVQQTTNRKGTLYVLVGLDEQQTKQATRDIVKGAMRQEAALWQPLKAGQSDDDVAAALAEK